eukprot:365730-Chlamydomonas_euryale.AAC.4
MVHAFGLPTGEGLTLSVEQKADGVSCLAALNKALEHCEDAGRQVCLLSVDGSHLEIVGKLGRRAL